MSTVNRSEILELLKSGKISAEEAAELLNRAAVEKAEPPAEPSAPEKPVEPVAAVEPAPATQPVNNGKTPTWFRVRVTNLETGKNKVTVNIPLHMLKFGLKIGGRFSPELEGLNWNEINEMMTDMTSGMLVEVQDDESNERVQVYLE